MAQCVICDRELEDKHCVRCYGAACRVCGEPLFRDESYKKDTRGRRHFRCARSAVERE